MGVWSACLLLLLIGHSWRQRAFWPHGAPVQHLYRALCLYCLAILWGWLQTQSWLPTAWYHPVWQSTDALDTTATKAISLSPHLFGESAARMLSYLCIFLTALLLGRDPQQAKLILKAIAFAAAAYALYGLVVQASSAKTILFYSKWAYQEFLTSTFVNKNSYATYAGLGLIATLALLWNSLKHKPKEASRDFSRANLLVRKFVRQDSLFLLLSVIVAGALILTSSRAGIFSGVVGAAVFTVLLALSRRWRLTLWLPMLMGGLFLLMVLIVFSGNYLIERMEREQIDAASLIRLNLYDAVLAAIDTRPLLGHGLGSFSDTIRFFVTQPSPKWFDHAHNDYLELMLELGIPAALLLIGAIGMMAGICLKGALNRRHMEIFPILGAAATLLVGVHGLFDFSLQIPAVAATYAAFLGLGVAQSWSLSTSRTQ